MSYTCMDRQRHTGLLLQTLLCWTLIGLCCAGHRPRERGERTRFTRHHERLTQRIQYPSLNDQGTQRIVYPSLNDEGTQGIRYPSVQERGQTVVFPNVNDDAGNLQIEKCAPGYYRDGSGYFQGRCVRCECNGLAEECEDKTGRCKNCQYNTAGDRCERCKEGYYGNAALRTCKICPCPFTTSTNSFAIGCKEVFAGLECICRAGYAGDKCESCAPGYYGDPLTPGGSCRPCNCNGNSKNCDSRTGVCKNTLEPKDTDTNEPCQECDNCAQTLLHDLEKLDDAMGGIKTKLDNASASASSQDRLKKLEKLLADTKILVNNFDSGIKNQKSKTNQLEDDVSTLIDDINSLRDKADKRAADADKAVADVDKTHNRAKDLDADIQNLLKKIQALLDQLKDTGTSGDKPGNDNLTQMLEDAKRMVKEMQDRNFTPQKTAAEKEKDEAKKLLEYIKADISKQSDQNEVKAEKLRGDLKGFGDKLKDLDKALKEAVDHLKKANAQNGLNAQALADLKKRINDLQTERATVKDQMTMAENELQKTEDLVEMLSDSKTEYEQLAAQLDGAKTDLNKKVNDITKAAAKEGIVVKAEDHAKNLAKLANELEAAVKNASGSTEVRGAKDAIDAYKNITDAINAADTAAKEAKSAADNALNNVKNERLTQRAKDLKKNSEELLENGKAAETDLQGARDDITDLKKRLAKGDTKKKTLEKDLLDAQNQLKDIKRDDIGQMIDEAKRKAALANETTSDTMARLNAIKKEMNKIRVTPVDSNLDSVLDDVNKSVNDLLKTIPSLNDKISEVENLTSQFLPISNISENIKKMKNLIEHARDAANRISIPMMFKGNGHVELRTPKDLEDLKAYTALSLKLQRPLGRGDGARRRRQSTNTGDMFVMYLGNKDSSKNYIGMVLKNNQLYGVYKLNGVEYQVKTDFISTSLSEPATFDQVDLRRIYQDAEISFTKVVTSNPTGLKTEYNIKGQENKNLLDISPNDFVFYVGGYPDNFTLPPSLDYPKYKGCIEFSSFNDKIVSLYNFQKAVDINIDLPCKRYVPPVESFYYEGTGYGKAIIGTPSSILVIKLNLFSRSDNSLLLFLQMEENYFTVTIENGIIFLNSNLLPEPTTNNIKTFPTTAWVDITIISTDRNGMKVIVGNVEVATASPVYNTNTFKELYIGGIPQDLREKYNITMQPFKGCMKSLKLRSNVQDLTEQVGISNGCPQDSLVARKAEFRLKSSLSANLEGFSLADDVTVSLGFKSTENQGLILQGKQLANGMNLKLENGHVILNFNNKIWKSNKQYNDDQWHYLTVTRRSGSIMLVIDDEDKGQEQSGSSSIPEADGAIVLGKDTFRGCISNLYTRRPNNMYKAEDFSTFKTSGNVRVDMCTADTLAQLMLDRTAKKR